MLTAMNVLRSGGQAQGILMGWPFAPLTAPSQLPTPSGFFPAEKPRSGASCAIWAAEPEAAPAAALLAGAAGAGAAGAGAAGAGAASIAAS